MQHFLLIATVALISEKLFFFLFPWEPLTGKQVPSSKSCSLSIKTIPGKMESNK